MVDKLIYKKKCTVCKKYFLVGVGKKSQISDRCDDCMKSKKTRYVFGVFFKLLFFIFLFMLFVSKMSLHEDLRYKQSSYDIRATKDFDIGIVEEFVDTIPKQYLRGINMIVLDPKPSRRAQIKSAITGVRYTGWYNPFTKNIDIFNDYSWDSTLIHEVGHHVWYHILSSDDRKQYTKFYGERSIFVSEYSLTNVEEGFAEDFSCFNFNDVKYSFVYRNESIKRFSYADRFNCSDLLPFGIQNMMKSITE